MTDLLLTLKRTYHPTGTSGQLCAPVGAVVCHTIELPWRNNARRVSCIPEGTYELVPRHTDAKGDHLHVLDVPGRDWILIHAANDASAELLGCVAPVLQLTGPDSGLWSRKALAKVVGLTYPVFKTDGKVFLHIVKA